MGGYIIGSVGGYIIGGVGTISIIGEDGLGGGLCGGWYNITGGVGVVGWLISSM